MRGFYFIFIGKNGHAARFFFQNCSKWRKMIQAHLKGKPILQYKHCFCLIYSIISICILSMFISSFLILSRLKESFALSIWNVIFVFASIIRAFWIILYSCIISNNLGAVIQNIYKTN